MCLFGIFISAISGADVGFSAADGAGQRAEDREPLTSKVCANHDCYYALAVDSSQPIAPVLRLALLQEETAIIGTRFAARAAAFDGMGNLNEGLLDEGEFIPSQGDEDRYWQSIYMLAQAGTGPALAVPQVIRAPSRVVQPQNHDGGAGHILATLQVRNIQVRAKWDVKNEGNNFTVSALAGDSRQGVLRVGDNIILGAGDYVVTVLAIDEFDYLNESYENLTAMAELTIEVVIEPLRDVGEVVLAVTLIEDVGEAAAYTFAVAGGIAPYSYTFIESQGLSVDAASGVLSYLADGAVPGVYVVTVLADDTAAASAPIELLLKVEEPGVYVVTVSADDTAAASAVPIELLLTVEVSAALSAALSEGARDGVDSFVNLASEVGKVMPSGGIGAYTFALVGGNDNGYFTINSSLGLISVNNVPESEDGNSYILVWSLNDGDERSPEVIGGVYVAFMKPPPPPPLPYVLYGYAWATANGDVEVSGSESSDGSYTSGQTFTFDPKTEQGVTLVLGSASDTAVVTAENGQIRVALKYFTQTNSALAAFSPSSGTFVMLDGKKLAQAMKDGIDAGKVAISFGGGTDNLSFSVADEIGEALAIDGGLLAIIAPAGLVSGDGVDIVSGVTYLLCNINGFGSILCELKEPTFEVEVLSAENALRYVVVNDLYSETISIPVVGRVLDSITGYTFALSPATGYSIGSTSGHTIVLNATNVAYTDAGVNYVTVSIHSQTPPQSGTFVLEVRVVPELTFSDTTLTISESESASLLSLVNGGNTMYAEDNERTFVVISDSAGFTADDGVLAVVGGAELLGLNTVTVQVMDTVPSQTATATLVIDVLEGAVKFYRENSNLPASIYDVPLSITLQAIGGSQSRSYTFSITEGGTNWLSIVSPNVLVVGAGAPASGYHTFKVKVVDGNSTKTDGTQEDEAEITFVFKSHAQAAANGNVEVSGSGSSDGSYTSGQTFTFDPQTEQGVTLVLGSASDTAVVTAENGQIRVTLKYFTQTNSYLAAFTPSSGTFVMLDGKKLAQAAKDGIDAGRIAISFGGGTDNLSFSVAEEIDEALAIKGGLLAIIAPAGLVNGDGVDIVSGVTYLLCNIIGFGSILCELKEPTSTEVLSAGNALRYAIVSEPYSETIQPSFAAADHYIGDQDRAATHQTVAHSVFADGDNGGQHF